MRFTFVILLFLSLAADAQMIIKAYPNYIPLGSSPFITSQAVYSIRKAVDSYTGSAMRIRKDTTGQPEQDINFIGNELDTASIKSFLNARSGFVVTWYNQNGSVNATQSTQANQPRIANLGVIDRLNGKVALVFDGVNDNLIADNLASSITGEDKPFSVIAVCSKANTNTTAAVLGFGRNTSTVPFLIPIGFVNQNNDYRFQIRDNATNNTFFDGGFYAANTQYLLSNYSTGLAFELFSNNISQITNTYNRGTLTLDEFCIGAVRRTANPDFPLAGRIQEIVYFNTYKITDRSTLETNINNYYGIY
jgi:hypothetical protein